MTGPNNNTAYHKEADNTLLLGFYGSEQKLFAHIIEHLITITLDNVGIPLSFHDCGAGYLRIGVDNKYLSANTLKQKIEGFNPDNDLCIREAKVVLSELCRGLFFRSFEKIYVLLEHNFARIEEYYCLLAELEKIIDNQNISQAIKQTAREIDWIVTDDREYDRKIEKTINTREIIKSRQNFFLAAERINNYVQAEIDLVVACRNAREAHHLFSIFEQMKYLLRLKARELGIYEVQSAIFNVWGQRLVFHFSTFLDVKSKDKFFRLVEDCQTEIINGNVFGQENSEVNIIDNYIALADFAGPQSKNQSLNIHDLIKNRLQNQLIIKN